MGEFSAFLIDKEYIKDVHKLISNIILYFKGNAEKFYPAFINVHCKFQIFQETNFLTKALEMRHLLFIIRKNYKAPQNVSYFEQIMSCLQYI